MTEKASASFVDSEENKINELILNKAGVRKELLTRGPSSG